MATPSNDQRTGALASLRTRVRRVVRGDQPLVVALCALLVLGVVVLSGPLQSYLDVRARVDGLGVTADALDRDIARLEQRAEDLADPRTIELTAREQQGFIRPGEVPYAIVPPEVARPQIAPSREVAASGERSWLERTWERLRRVVS